MVGDARLLILLPLETRQVAPDNAVLLTLKPGDQLIILVFAPEIT